MTAPYPAPPPYGVPPRPTRTRGGTVVVVVLIGVILLCLGVGTTGYLLVVRVGPGASTPASAADRLLDAIFKQQDEKAASQYVCAKQRDARSVQQLLTQAARYQGTVTWSAPKQESRAADSAKVSAELRLRQGTGTGSGYAHQQWRFAVVDEHGWRVCGINTGR